MPKTLTCADCGKPMQQQPTSRPQGQARCHECRRANPAPKRQYKYAHTRKREPYGSKRGHCADCGQVMWRGKGMLPDGQARCQPCRRARPVSGSAARPSVAQTCKQCGIEYTRRHRNKGWCSTKCYGDSRVIRADCDWGLQRGKRESSAPGLTKNGRDKLRAKWKRQQKPCEYCGARADTVDHVIPLVRGGTNYEGNLVPACRRCNSSKSGKTIIEWRHGVSLGKVRDAPEWLGKSRPQRVTKPKPVRIPREPHDCPICGTSTLRPVYCSPECSTERVRRDLRDRYRMAHGLPVDPNRPVKSRTRLQTA